MAKAKSETNEVPAAASTPPHKRVVRRKQWKKPKDKPCRNLSAYNYFFKLKRQQILDEAAGAEERSSKDSKDCVGFAGLARSVAETWKDLGQSNPSLKVACEQMAELDRERYRLELEEWRNKQPDAMCAVQVDLQTSGEGREHFSDQDPADTESREDQRAEYDTPDLTRITCDEEMAFPDCGDRREEAEDDKDTTEGATSFAPSLRQLLPVADDSSQPDAQMSGPNDGAIESSRAVVSVLGIGGLLSAPVFEGPRAEESGAFDPLPFDSVTFAQPFNNPTHQFELDIILSLAKG